MAPWPGRGHAVPPAPTPANNAPLACPARRADIEHGIEREKDRGYEPPSGTRRGEASGDRPQQHRQRCVGRYRLPLGGKPDPAQAPRPEAAISAQKAPRSQDAGAHPPAAMPPGLGYARASSMSSPPRNAGSGWSCAPSASSAPASKSASPIWLTTSPGSPGSTAEPRPPDTTPVAAALLPTNPLPLCRQPKTRPTSSRLALKPLTNQVLRDVQTPAKGRFAPFNRGHSLD